VTGRTVIVPLHDELARGTIRSKKSAFARAVALRVLQYRVGNGLSQTELATRLRMKQSRSCGSPKD
jgi:ribosome-binding protein aMBF1 (putative translation factor)